jgi:hypothetical protein
LPPTVSCQFFARAERKTSPTFCEAMKGRKLNQFSGSFTFNACPPIITFPFFLTIDNLWAFEELTKIEAKSSYPVGSKV